MESVLSEWLSVSHLATILCVICHSEVELASVVAFLINHGSPLGATFG